MKPPNLVLSDPLPFYNGEVILYFCSKKDGKPAHEYYLETKEGLELQDGVTTACGIIDKSMYLMPWAVKMMALRLVEIIPIDKAFGTTLQPIPFMEFTALIDKAKKAHKEIKEDAADVGTMAHNWLEDSIRWAITFNQGVVDNLTVMAPLDERAISCGQAAHSWMKSHNVRWIKTEKKIYSRKYKYAGTMDGMAYVDSCTDSKCCQRIFEDELSLIDWKSSNRLRTEYLYQTAAYQSAEMEEGGADIKSRWILRLGKEDGKFEPWYELNFAEDLETFLYCLYLHRAHKNTERRMSELNKIKTFVKREEKKKLKSIKS